MKLGIVISLVIVIAFAGFGFYLWYGKPVAATSATAQGRLAQVELPSDLPAMFTPSEQDAIGNPRYADAMKYYYREESALRPGNEDPEVVERLADLYIHAMNAARMDDELFDKAYPIKLGREFSPPPSDPARATPSILLAHARALYDEGQTDRGFLITQAVWSFGERLFRHSVRLHNREIGIAVMQAALVNFREMAVQFDEPEETIGAWSRALDKVRATWDPKLKNVLKAAEFNVADMIRLAQADDDRTFRVEATLRLGLAKFRITGRGDERAVQTAIDEAKASDDWMIQQAGESADALTEEEFRRL